MLKKTTPPKKSVEEIYLLLKNHPETEWCAPENLEPLKIYSLKIKYSRNHRDGNFWEGVLSKNNKPIMAVENRGDGGCNFYYSIKKDEYWSPFEAEFEKITSLAYPKETCATSRKDIAIAFLDLVQQNR